MNASLPYQAVLLVSFGGPEQADDVLPFLDRVLRRRNVPPERKLEVAEHYYHFGGKSPINDHNRALRAAIEAELRRRGLELPVFWGNRNWHPLLEETTREMRQQGVRRALAFATSAFGSYSGCRQYIEDLDSAMAAAGGPEILRLDKIRLFFNHPGFIAAQAERIGAALAQIPPERRAAARLWFTAHSVPLRMAEASPYVAQLEEAARLTAEELARWRPELAKTTDTWRLAYQSRSGPPGQPWLEPDILAALRQTAAEGVRDVAVAPIGFLSDHMEVLYDLDYEARDMAEQLGLGFYRAETVGEHPEFVKMIGELVEERLFPDRQQRFMGNLGVAPDKCPANCCR